MKKKAVRWAQELLNYPSLRFDSWKCLLRALVKITSKVESYLSANGKQYQNDDDGEVVLIRITLHWIIITIWSFTKQKKKTKVKWTLNCKTWKLCNNWSLSICAVIQFVNCRSEWDKRLNNQVDIECVVAFFFRLQITFIGLRMKCRKHSRMHNVTAQHSVPH